VSNTTELSKQIYTLEEQIHKVADKVYPSIKKRGGGYQKIEIDEFPKEHMLSLKVHVDTCDAMGANIINTILEGIASDLETELDNKKTVMSILYNYNATSVISIEGKINIKDLEKYGMSGEEVASRMERAAVLADIAPYRAVTHY